MFLLLVITENGLFDCLMFFLDDCFRRDVMRFVVGDLPGTPVFGDFQELFDGVGDDVRIQDYASFRVSCGASGNLNQRPFRTEEALFIRVKDRHEPHFRQVDAFPEKVDADQTVERAVAQFRKNAHTFDRVDFGMEIFDAHSEVGEVVGEPFRAFFGERGDDGPCSERGVFTDLFHHIVHLIGERTDLDLRIKKPGRAHDLFHNLVPRKFEFVIGRRRGNVDGIARDLRKFFEFQRTVVQCGRQTEAVFDESLFAAPVGAVHRLKLGNRHMRFVDHGDEIFLEEIQQTVRTRAGSASREVTGIVFNSGTIPDFAHHFHVVVHALEQTLRFHEFILILQFLDAHFHFREDRRRCRVQFLLRHYEKFCGKDKGFRELGEHFPGQYLTPGDGFDGVAPELNAGELLFLGKEDVDAVAAHAELGFFRGHVVADVLDRDEKFQQFVAVHFHSGPQVNAHVGIVGRRPLAVDAGDAGNGNDVAPFDQRRRGGEPEPFDVVVDAGVFGNIGIGLRNVGFRQIIVVVTDEVFHGVVRKKRFEFTVKLCREGFVVGEHKHRTVHLRDDVCKSKGFSRSGDALQSLITFAGFQPADKRVDRSRLISGGGVIGN